MAKQLTSSILERVDRRLEKLGLSDRYVSMKASGQPDVIRNWRSKNVLPRLDTLLQVANALSTTPEWLAFGTGDEDSNYVPLISWVSAGSFSHAEGVNEFDDFPHIPIAGLDEGDWVALRVVGDSMDRISPPDSIIVVNRADRQLISNACYIVQDGDGGATYKRYRPNPDRFEPVSTNPIHEPLFPDGGNMPHVFGRVARSFIDL